MHPFSGKLLQYRPAAFGNILIGFLKISRIPGVRHIPCFSRPVKKAGNFFLRIPLGETGQVIQIFFNLRFRKIREEIKGEKKSRKKGKK